MKVGLVGSGLQGWRRARALDFASGDRLAIAADIDLSAAQRMAAEFGCEATQDWRKVVEEKAVEAVLVCTPPHLHSLICTAALEAGKDVLCEKPLGRNPQEAKSIVQAAQRNGARLKCGLNYRHFPGIRQARLWYDQGCIGEVMYIRCRHGIGGRPGYEQEWRARGEISGGGELMDQGLHILDLARWFLGEFAEVFGFLGTYYWKVAPLEDNVFAILRTATGKTASLHVSWTQWKNLFSFEIFGREGYITVEGLGGSYGTQRASLGKRDLTAPFRQEVIDYRGEDRSWVQEWKEFKAAIAEGREPLGNGQDGFQAVRLAYAIYEAARRGSPSECPSGL